MLRLIHHSFWVSAVAIPRTATLQINGNDFRGLVNSAAASHQQTYISWSSGSNTTTNVDGNTFTNLNVNTTGSVTFLNRGTSSMTATGSLSVSNNQIVTAFNKASAGGTVTGFTNSGGDGSPNGSIITGSGNDFSNITLTGGTAFVGWNDSNGASSSNGPTKTVTNNTFSNISTGSGAMGADLDQLFRTGIGYQRQYD